MFWWTFHPHKEFLKKKWTSDHVKNPEYPEWIETDIMKIRNQDFTGWAFLCLTEKKLTCKPGPYELKPSPAESIIKLVEKLK